MPKRPPNYRQVKISRSYAVDEIACLFGIHKNYRARKGESRTPDQRRKRPVLILENDLTSFLEARRAGHNRPRKAGEFYCFRGRSPKAPVGSMTDCWSVTDELATGQTICSDCCCLMNRKVSLAKLDDFHRILAITLTKEPEQVIWIAPNVNQQAELATARLGIRRRWVAGGCGRRVQQQA